MPDPRKSEISSRAAAGAMRQFTTEPVATFDRRGFRALSRRINRQLSRRRKFGFPTLHPMLEFLEGFRG